MYRTPFCCAAVTGGAFGPNLGPIIPFSPLKSDPRVNPRVSPPLGESMLENRTSWANDLLVPWASFGTGLPGADRMCEGPIPRPRVPPIARIRTHCCWVRLRSLDQSSLLADSLGDG